MSEIRFDCTQCRQPLSVEAEAAGQTFACPNCGASVTAPATSIRPSHAAVPPVVPPPLASQKKKLSVGVWIAIIAGIVVAGIFLVGVLAALLLPAIQTARKRADQAKAHFTTKKTLSSADGTVEITVPGDWTKATLNPKAQLQAGCAGIDEFLIVISDKKSDYPSMTFAKYSSLVGGNVAKKLESAETTGPIEMQVNGQHAVQYVIKGIFTDARQVKMSVVYLQTLLEDSANFHQILAWTRSSRYDQNKVDFQNIIASFKTKEAGNR